MQEMEMPVVCSDCRAVVELNDTRRCEGCNDLICPRCYDNTDAPGYCRYCIEMGIADEHKEQEQW